MKYRCDESVDIFTYIKNNKWRVPPSRRPGHLRKAWVSGSPLRNECSEYASARQGMIAEPMQLLSILIIDNYLFFVYTI